MRREYILVGVALIFGATIFIQYFAERLYPVEEMVVEALPEFEEGVVQVYVFYKEGEEVGTYRYSVAGGGGPGAYAMRSTTEVSYGGDSLRLDGLYVFDEGLRPVSYSLNASEGGETSRIASSFGPDTITTRAEAMGESIELTEPTAENLYLVENAMPGYWEVLLQSMSLEPGKRHQASVFIPQMGRVVKITLVVNRGASTLRVGERTLECTVIKEAGLSLVFYLCGGELVEYRDEAQGVTLRKIL